MSREAMQQALTALNVYASKAEHKRTRADDCAAEDAIAALKAALAEQKCPCGDRPADQCPGEWEPGCDLGANEKYAKVAEQAQSLRDLCAAAYQVVGVADGPVEMLDNLWAAAEGKPLPHDPGAGLPWSPPSPRPLSGLDVERLLEDVVGSLPVARKLIRAVEAEVIRRIWVQR